MFRLTKPVSRILLVSIVILLPILIISLIYWNQHRTVPIERALNPIYWVKHWRGLDLYDPKTNLLEHGSYKYPEVALTIDDGPDPRYGPEIVKILHDNNIHATFFLVGTKVKQYPDLTRLIAKNGFEIGNHTYDHQRLPDLKPHEIANEIRFCERNIKSVTGIQTKYLRPPGVQYNDKVLNAAKALDYTTISWTCGAKDYDIQPPEYIARRIIERTENGSIIILHQDNASTAKALPFIIRSLKEKRYNFVTISEMLDRIRQ